MKFLLNTIFKSLSSQWHRKGIVMSVLYCGLTCFISSHDQGPCLCDSLFSASQLYSMHRIFNKWFLLSKEVSSSYLSFDPLASMNIPQCHLSVEFRDCCRRFWPRFFMIIYKGVVSVQAVKKSKQRAKCLVHSGHSGICSTWKVQVRCKHRQREKEWGKERRG